MATASNQEVTQDESYHHPKTVDELTRRNIRTIAELDKAAQSNRTFTDRVVDEITAFCGRMTFVWVHVIWFTAWILLNRSSLLPAKAHFDPYPFNLLTLVVSLEAIFLSTFILISQNRQARISERRNHLDLQIDLLSEQENTKVLTMVAKILDHLGIPDSEPDVAILESATQPAHMVEQIEELIEGEDHEGHGKHHQKRNAN